MTLIVNSERWCEAASEVESQDRGRCCGDVATSVCEVCGVALCDAHEICCLICFGVTCSTCDHACRSLKPSTTKAA
jgi:hypothetical protein